MPTPPKELNDFAELRLYNGVQRIALEIKRRDIKRLQAENRRVSSELREKAIQVGNYREVSLAGDIQRIELIRSSSAINFERHCGDNGRQLRPSKPKKICWRQNGTDLSRNTKKYVSLIHLTLIDNSDNIDI
jgi:hypothetical protein